MSVCNSTANKRQKEYMTPYFQARIPDTNTMGRCPKRGQASLHHRACTPVSASLLVGVGLSEWELVGSGALLPKRFCTGIFPMHHRLLVVQSRSKPDLVKTVHCHWEGSMCWMIHHQVASVRYHQTKEIERLVD